MITTQLKRDQEKWVASSIINCLQLRDFYFDRMGNDINEPDVIFNSNGIMVGFEIASAYLDEECARFEWDYARGNRSDFGATSPLQINPKEKFSIFLQRLLYVKCKKSLEYTGVDQLWLGIEERNPLSNSNAIKSSLKSIQLPENKFDQIHILHLSPLHEGGKYKVFTLK